MATPFDKVILCSNSKEKRRFKRSKPSTQASYESPRTVLSRAAQSKSEPLSDISSRKASRCLSVKHWTHRRSIEEVCCFQKELLRFHQRQSQGMPRCRLLQDLQCDAGRGKPAWLSIRSQEPGAAGASLPKTSKVRVHNRYRVRCQRSLALVRDESLLNRRSTGRSSRAPAWEGEFENRMSLLRVLRPTQENAFR